MELRVKKECLENGRTKKDLKALGVKIKVAADNNDVKVLTLPKTIRMTSKESKPNVYYLHEGKRKLGKITNPFDFEGGLLTFEP